MEKIIEVNMFCDESGQLGLKSLSKYFVIGGYFCLKEKSKEITDSYVHQLKKVKEKRKMEKNEELKTRDMNDSEKILLFNSLFGNKGFYGFSIIVDKGKLPGTIHKESIFFNYLIKVIVQDILVPKILEIIGDIEINVNIRIDNRNIAVDHMKSLEDYLNSEYLFSRFTFQTTYCDSRFDYGIQATDLIANTVYMSYKDESKVKDVISKIDMNRIYVNYQDAEDILASDFITSSSRYRNISSDTLKDVS